MVVVMSVGVAPISRAQGPELPFRPGERLRYKLNWEFINAGEATLEVFPQAEVEGEKACRFVLTVRSNAVVDSLYKVRDRVESFTDMAVSRSLLYTQELNEGRHHRKIVVTFDWEKGITQFENMGKKEKPVVLRPGAFDPLAVFYSFRLRTPVEHSDMEAPVTDGRKMVTGRARVLGRETIRVEGGEFDTYLIEPELKEIGGVFRKSRNATLKLWVSADSRKIPVKIASKVVVGNFVAELISAEGV